MTVSFLFYFIFRNLIFIFIFFYIGICIFFVIIYVLIFLIIISKRFDNLIELMMLDNYTCAIVKIIWFSLYYFIYNYNNVIITYNNLACGLGSGFDNSTCVFLCNQIWTTYIDVS